MVDLLPSQEPAGTRITQASVLRVPVPKLRYHQRRPEHGAGSGPERIVGLGMPEHHVLHRTLDF